MSKKIKQLEIASLLQTFENVRDMVALSVVGLDAQGDNAMRHELRKKNIRIKVVKNSLVRQAFLQLGINIPETSKVWEGPTTFAWGSDSLADLSKTINGIAKKDEKVFKVKAAVSEGNEVTFKQALEMPTRAEAIGTILAMILGPGSQIAAQIVGPARQIAGQIKTLSEKAPEPSPA